MLTEETDTKVSKSFSGAYLTTHEEQQPETYTQAPHCDPGVLREIHRVSRFIEGTTAVRA